MDSFAVGSMMLAVGVALLVLAIFQPARVEVRQTCFVYGLWVDCSKVGPVYGDGLAPAGPGLPG